MSEYSQEKHRRILLKLSGEVLGGDSLGIDPSILAKIGDEIAKIQVSGVQIALVIGGGNIFRGAALQKAGLDRVAGDQMGMLATMINGLALRDELTRQGIRAVLMSPHSVPSICMQYQAVLGRDILSLGSVLILAGGTGSPLFTTDTTAVLRGVELGCDEVLKGTKVDGVYSADPVKNPNATFYPRITYEKVLEQKIEVMDLTAFTLARENNMPIRVFNMNKEGALMRAATGGDEGSLVSAKE